MSKILITGASGLLGSSISPYFLRQNYQVMRHGNNLGVDVNSDLTNYESTQTILDKICPDIIINLVALTDVDSCERNPHNAYLINTKTVENIVKWVKKNSSCHLIHISTDQVYDNEGPSKENDLKLVNTYAFSKYAADLIALQVNATILRTNFFGYSNCNGKISFSDWVLKALHEQEITKVFTDVKFSPLLIATLCKMLDEVVKSPKPGIFNLGSKFGMSKANFAFNLAKSFDLNSSNLKRTLSSSFQFEASRPNDMQMDSSYFEKTFKVKLPSLSDEIDKLVQISKDR
jgi:dTDP-4-dehydrorhamnose reductase